MSGRALGLALIVIPALAGWWVWAVLYAALSLFLGAH